MAILLSHVTSVNCCHHSVSCASCQTPVMACRLIASSQPGLPFVTMQIFPLKDPTQEELLLPNRHMPQVLHLFPFLVGFLSPSKAGKESLLPPVKLYAQPTWKPQPEHGHLGPGWFSFSPGLPCSICSPYTLGHLKSPHPSVQFPSPPSRFTGHPPEPEPPRF